MAKCALVQGARLSREAPKGPSSVPAMVGSAQPSLVAQSAPSLELPKTMFSQYGSNLTPEGNVFKTLGAIVVAASVPSQTATVSEAPQRSNMSDSLLNSPLSSKEGPEVGALNTPAEADSSRAREWRSKLNQDRACRGAAPG